MDRYRVLKYVLLAALLVTTVIVVIVALQLPSAEELLRTPPARGQE